MKDGVADASVIAPTFHTVRRELPQRRYRLPACRHAFLASAI